MPSRNWVVKGAYSHLLSEVLIETGPLDEKMNNVAALTLAAMLGGSTAAVAPTGGRDPSNPSSMVSRTPDQEHDRPPLPFAKELMALDAQRRAEDANRKPYVAPPAKPRWVISATRYNRPETFEIEADSAEEAAQKLTFRRNEIKVISVTPKEAPVLAAK